MAVGSGVSSRGLSRNTSRANGGKLFWLKKLPISRRKMLCIAASLVSAQPSHNYIHAYQILLNETYVYA